MTSTDVFTVAPVEYYLAYLRHQPGFHEGARRVLANVVNDLARRHSAAVRHALHVLPVTIACVSAHDPARYRDLRGFGFTSLARSATYRCLQRP